jgi:aerobic carbon-monoxide dehydrogenase medium subunit
MKAAPFGYRSPESLGETLDLLAREPDDASLLAGGQSLVPMLNMRIARPETVIDLNRVSELAGIQRNNGSLRIGAMTRQRTLERDAAIARTLPILPEALEHVAHLAIRTRGTIGGSIAHADPSAELPAAMLALDAILKLRSQSASRTLPAKDFFLAPLMTAIEPGELLEAIEVPVPPPRTGWGFAEVARTHGAFALVGAIAGATINDQTVGRVRLVLFGVGPAPLSIDCIEDVIRGRNLEDDDEMLAEVEHRVSGEVEPVDDVHASAAYRRRAAGVLARRVLRQAVARAVASDQRSPTS